MRERERQTDSLVKVGGAWHAWRRKHKAWFERVSTLSLVGPDTSALLGTSHGPRAVPVRDAHGVLRHASITRVAEGAEKRGGQREGKKGRRMKRGRREEKEKIEMVI